MQMLHSLEGSFVLWTVTLGIPGPAEMFNWQHCKTDQAVWSCDIHNEFAHVWFTQTVEDEMGLIGAENSFEEATSIN